MIVFPGSAQIILGRRLYTNHLFTRNAMTMLKFLKD